MDPDIEARIDAITGTLEATPGPNDFLPVLNPFVARSTYAAVVAILSVLSPFIGGGIGEVLAYFLNYVDATISMNFEDLVHLVNAVIGMIGVVWFWFERRAPNYRLSFRKG